MTRETILAEINKLERMKAESPHLALGINQQITELCDRLKSLTAFKPRSVV